MDLLTVLILILDFVFSIWNAYASGYNIGIVRYRGASGFLKIAAYAGLGLAYSGVSYIMTLSIAYVGAYFGFVDPGVAAGALAFAFLVFGALIIGFGLIVTIQSIEIAVRTRSIWSVLGAGWNIFAEIWDLYSYASGFQEAVGVLRSEDREESAQDQLIIIVVVALLIAYFITHAAYKQGLRKAQQASR